MPIRFTPIPTETAAALRAGARDAYGLVPERQVSDGPGNPCRHCLRPIPEGRAMLVLAYRPFHRLQPYAETGPIFLCADPCEPWAGEGLPPALASAEYNLRAYGHDHRILYGTGGIVATAAIPARAEALLADPATAFLHLRSAKNTCFQCRVDRA